MPAPVTPLLAADCIIELIDRPGHPIVLIERKNPPPGWAIPGGFVDVGEAVEDAAIREAAEETGLEVWLKDMLGVYSDPGRDPRGHTVSVVYVAIAVGEPRAMDDARALGVFSPDTLPEPLAFDHADVLADYLHYRATGKVAVPQASRGAPPHGISPLVRGPGRGRE
jgi:8-oxo-dGTP diphosphatase